MAHTTATARYIDDEEGDEDVCRICRTPGDTDNPLQYPCACRGSIKFVHQDCLLQWLSYCKAHQCEVCKHRFSFSPLYAEHAPTRLPFNEFVVGIGMKVCSCRALHVFLRLCLVLSVWFLTIPFITFWTWRLAFVQSFGEAQRLFLSHMSTVVVLADCLLGFLLSTTIIFILSGAATLRDYFRHLRMYFQFYVRFGMHGPVYDNAAFPVLASNMIFLGVVIFVPFTLGRFILYHVLCVFADARGPASVSNLTHEGQENGLVSHLLKCFVAGAGPPKLYVATTCTDGHMFGDCLVFIYLGLIPLIQYLKGEPLTAGRFYGGVASIVETIPPLLRQFYGGVVFVLMLGVVPLMCGWLLDVCTVKVFGKTMSHRVEFLSVSPLASSLVHWVVGLLYLLKIIIFEELLQQVLRPGVLNFFYDPEYEDDTFQLFIEEPVHKLARNVLLDSAKLGSLIVLLVFLPVKLAIRMAPSIFPLNISVSDPFTEIPAGMLLFTICTQFIIEHFRLWTAVESLVRFWFTCVGWALGLTDFLLPRPEDNVGQDNGNGEPGRQNRGQSDSERYNFVLRIVLLLLAAWITLLLFNTTLIVVPVSVGRALFNAIPTLPITHGIIKYNDLYAYVIGTYAFWTTISGAMYTIEHVKSKRTSRKEIWKWCEIVFKSSVLLAIWVFVIPVLIGLVFELLVIVPMRVPVDESPVFLLYQDWPLGLIVLKIWSTLVSTLFFFIILLDDSWKAKFERVEGDRFSRLQGLWVFREILFPIVMKLLTALCVPYVLARGVFPMLGYPLVVNSAVYRYAWIGCLSVSLVCFCANRCHVWFRNLHNSIRDDRYLIGRRLHNFGEAVLAHQNQSSEDAGDGGVLTGR
ncbi:hypothetical protein Bca52824_038404 [Brassica carinata]|uniref:RING-type E3 ubiquitin transferase n=1 Tax=Brassica carinata TaxID=52824 RepID=A0A8X7UTP0_BRACI|nr:hypothetical protein Bca52824_038404 [Brassica carinata]